MTKPILPGATLGVLGSGQLGRMFTIAARRLGYRVHVLSPDHETPTGQVADLEIQADYHDLDRVAEFAKGVSVVTFEFENVPAETTEVCNRFGPVRPAGSVLYTSQNRLREKTFLRDAGLPVTPFVSVTSVDELLAGLKKQGIPSVLKTADWGYDGKGQVVIRSVDAAATAWASLNVPKAILESFIDFDCEISVVAARGLDGQFVSYGPIGNAHHNHILDVSVCPARVPASVAKQAIEIARAVVESLNVVGVLCVEFFVTRSGELLINETAPRPHNSGHLTIDAHVTCQFEQQVRAICGLPLGSSELRSPSAMANLLGDVWEPGEPNWPAALAHPNLKLHLYGKQAARIGRKMGHLTVLSDNVDEAEQTARAARDALMWR
ncbi:5-(carboxyamino)imidazole ribonucleotide synthase [Schlesneria paludicola]|uniref:5-(carboxyamino)imidazole ribonucleotide synthase n=1 Tax=Schlesneria paludicola TaxID=360056 RepID=UPI00029A3960|nr:5-(carboxyamino)imidazole ribonucleotide synthase [Schlesneria paludicola]